MAHGFLQLSKGKVWTLVAWCELRDDFRVFRLDRIDHCATTGETFTLGDWCQTLHDFYRRIEEEHGPNPR